MEVSSGKGDLPERRKRTTLVRNGEAHSGAVGGPSNEGGSSIGKGRQFLRRTSIDVGSIQVMILGEDDCAPVGGPGRVMADQTTQTPAWKFHWVAKPPIGVDPTGTRHSSRQLRAVRRNSGWKRPSERSQNRARRTIDFT